MKSKSLSSSLSKRQSTLNVVLAASERKAKSHEPKPVNGYMLLAAAAGLIGESRKIAA